MGQESAVGAWSLGDDADIDPETTARNLVADIEGIDRESVSIQSTSGVIDGHASAVADDSYMGTWTIVTVVSIEKQMFALLSMSSNDDEPMSDLRAVHESLNVDGDEGPMIGDPPSLEAR
jgi:hypothetical protein